MRLLTRTLCLLSALALSCAAPTHHDIMMADHHENNHSVSPDRCDGLEFDAIAPDETGTTYFFKGDHLWKGYVGPAELSNETFKELDDNHTLGNVDAAFRMHNGNDPKDHDHLFIFLNNKVFSYYNHSLEPDYPKEIQDVFPGIPNQLDAAVECPKGECNGDTVIFFKGDELHYYDISTKTVKQKKWSHLPNCTSAYRWLERYYCFHGHSFTRFHPVTGDVEPHYPKDARNYFMKCENFGHGSDSAKCNADTHLDAVTSDNKGKAYAFRGKVYLRLDSQRDGWHGFSINSAWKEVDSDVDAVFFHDEKLYIIKGDEVYIYKTGAPYTLVEGYPKPLKEELGIEGPVDAAFVCAGEHTVHIIQGKNMKDIDLSATPRTLTRDVPHPFSKIDAASCGPKGVRVYVGTDYFEYESPMIMLASKRLPIPNKVPQEMLGCRNWGSKPMGERKG